MGQGVGHRDPTELNSTHAQLSQSFPANSQSFPALVEDPSGVLTKSNKEVFMDTVSNVVAELLNEHDVARITGLSVASVRRWRLFRQGPKYLKIGAAVRYRTEDIRSWLDSRPAGGER